MLGSPDGAAGRATRSCASRRCTHGAADCDLGQRERGHVRRSRFAYGRRICLRPATAERGCAKPSGNCSLCVCEVIILGSHRYISSQGITHTSYAAALKRDQRAAHLSPARVEIFSPREGMGTFSTDFTRIRTGPDPPFECLNEEQRSFPPTHQPKATTLRSGRPPPSLACSPRGAVPSFPARTTLCRRRSRGHRRHGERVGADGLGAQRAASAHARPQGRQAGPCARIRRRMLLRMRVLFLMKWAQEDRMLAASIALATIMVGSMSALLCCM